ncbi:DNA methyltransferase [Siccirubricoccus soli]|nr:DNA methyltransferase [Siccirubricoccus soli]
MSGAAPKAKRGRAAAADAQLALDVTVAPRAAPVFIAPAGARAIEDESFPFEVLSDIAEAESWRKEIHRPIHYVHKWWARRLGTVFRAIVAGTLAPSGKDVMQMLYEPTRFPGAVVLDPFMGSGVTLGEALKLGARAIGRDINPVAYFLVRNALARHDRAAVKAAFEHLEREVAPQIRHYYRARLPDGREGETLYYFWVKQLPCPSCGNSVDLFSSRVFSQNAYPKKVPRAQATCPGCGEVNEVRYDAAEATCHDCGECFNPQSGPASGQRACCPSCSHKFSIAKAVRDRGEPPSHRLYAKLVLTPENEKVYLRPDALDFALYAEAEAALAARRDPYPLAEIAPGYNTDQALGYNYKFWHQFFNSRQLLCLSLLADGIRAIADAATRELMACLFSGALEFNNMFTSFKGEGTGAVRHMFSHHILKPERVPLEANLWGTPASSGSFSGLFDSRILRALKYAEEPTEIRLAAPRAKAEKVGGLSDPIGFVPARNFTEFRDTGARLYLSCGNSAQTDIDDASVDVVVTDPPFFDNVHYSQLADFFHVWQRHILGGEGERTAPTTRASGEVQDEDGDKFAKKLGDVLTECRRVLRPDGLLAFSYHHSRDEGWSAVLEALMRAGFHITAAHPVKAEMSVAQPKALAKEPIDLDIILACRKNGRARPVWNEAGLWQAVEATAGLQVRRLVERGRKLSRNDVRVIVMAQALRRLSAAPSAEAALKHLVDGEAGAIIDRLHHLSAAGVPEVDLDV